jgi:glycerol-3-phosphate dehydrogenase
MAEDAVDRAIKLASLPERVCTTKDLAIHGAAGHSENSDPLQNYGSDAKLITGLIREQPGLAAPLHKSLPICGAQIIWAARQEMARTLDDVLARRTRALFLNAPAALAMAPAVARLLATTLGRDEAWEKGQLAAFNEIAAGFLPNQSGVV